MDDKEGWREKVKDIRADSAHDDDDDDGDVEFQPWFNGIDKT